MGYRRYKEEDYDGGSDDKGPLSILLAEKSLIVLAYSRYNGDRDRMAKALGICTKTLGLKIDAHRLKKVVVLIEGN